LDNERGIEMVKKIWSRLRDDAGASAVEYGLIVSLIAAALVTVVGTLGGKIVTAFTAIVTALN
jgi:pilus assembly protein Flp/PilA